MEIAKYCVPIQQSSQNMASSTVASFLDDVEIRNWEYFHVLEWAKRSGFTEQTTFDTIYNLKLNGEFLLSKIPNNMAWLDLDIHETANVDRFEEALYTLRARHDRERHKTVNSTKVADWTYIQVLHWANFYNFKEKETLDLIYKLKIDGKRLLSENPSFTAVDMLLKEELAVIVYNFRIKELRERHYKEAHTGGGDGR
jgi:hypothetical protein